MANSEMRKFMQASQRLYETKQVDEAGGFIDKAMAKVGSKGAKGRVDVEKERKDILDAWKEHKGAQGLSNKDVEGFKEFLLNYNFSQDEANKIVGGSPFKIKDAILRAAKVQHLSRKGVTGAERGGPRQIVKPTNDDYAAIMKFFASKEVGGNLSQLKLELASVKNAKQLTDPLSALGYAYLTANKLVKQGK